MRFLLLIALCFCFSWVQAQNVAPRPTKSEWKPVSPTYQLYLDKPVIKIIDVKYQDGTPLKFDLGKDKETVYLLDYHKRGGVTIKAETADGNEIEFRRSPCVIDPVIQS